MSAHNRARIEQEATSLQGKVIELIAQGSSVAQAVVNALQLKDPKPVLARELFRLSSKLPALTMRSRIEEVVLQSRFLVIKGHTGSGKSTQIPQYLADMPQFAGKKAR